MINARAERAAADNPANRGYPGQPYQRHPRIRSPAHVSAALYDLPNRTLFHIDHADDKAFKVLLWISWIGAQGGEGGEVSEIEISINGVLECLEFVKMFDQFPRLQ